MTLMDTEGTKPREVRQPLLSGPKAAYARVSAVCREKELLPQIPGLHLDSTQCTSSERPSLLALPQILGTVYLFFASTLSHNLPFRMHSY